MVKIKKNGATVPRPVKTNPGFGGSFAPPLTDEKLVTYANLAEETGGEAGEAMRELLAVAQRWWELPASQGTPTSQHQAGEMRSMDGKKIFAPPSIVSLSSEVADELDPLIPYARQLKAMADVFEEMPSGTIEVVGEETGRAYCKVVDNEAHDKRNAAFHLLWYANELSIGREPITSDMLVEI